MQKSFYLDITNQTDTSVDNFVFSVTKSGPWIVNKYTSPTGIIKFHWLQAGLYGVACLRSSKCPVSSAKSTNELSKEH